ncbi:MAG: hypothetical protein RL736_246 [Pseudomonadota bacterium]|jgi:hypothetical protein
MLAISTYATKSYFYIWPQFLRRISAAAAHHAEAYFILATDNSKESKNAFELAKKELPEGWKLVCLNLDVEEHELKYKEDSQILIAKLQNAAFSFARKIRVDFLWSVESDMLVSEESLKISEWVLQMPDLHNKQYYDVAACTYPNLLFLGGFGSPESQIANDFSYEERIIPSRFKMVYEKRQEIFKKLKKDESKILKNKILTKDHQKELKDLNLKLKKIEEKLRKLSSKISDFPPDGNIWDITAKYGWKRRGWFDFAYPGIGRGSIVPSDWCGLGCTLMSKKALSLSEFSGYNGKGTQDLFLCWDKWYPKDIRIACIPHCPCDHVKVDKIEKKIIHHKSFYETTGEFKNHLRLKSEEWIPT